MAYFQKFLFQIIYFLTCLFVFPSFIHAHPLDELGEIQVYDQKQILTLNKDQIELKIETKFFAFEKTLVWESLDTNRNRQISDDEKNNWLQLGRNSSWIRSRDSLVYFEPRQVLIADYFDFFSPPPSTITLIYTLDLDLANLQTFEYHYQGKDKKLQQIQFEALSKSDFSISSEKISPDSIRLYLDKSNSSGAVTVINNPLGSSKNSDDLENFLNRYLKTESIPFTLKLWALVIAFAIGALHALTPGHGKAITAGFLIGERGTVWHALHLGAIITFTHTFSVFLLGLGALLLTQYIVPDAIIKWLHFFSGLLVLFFGLYLIVIRSRKILNSKFSNLKSSHTHTIYQHSSHHQHHDHHHQHLSHKHLLPLGIAGGIVPCIDALAILIVAVSLNKILFGLILLISFSLGLATVLIAGGVFVVIAKNKAASRFRNLAHHEPYLNLFSAIIVTLLGVLLLLTNN